MHDLSGRYNGEGGSDELRPQVPPEVLGGVDAEGGELPRVSEGVRRLIIINKGTSRRFSAWPARAPARSPLHCCFPGPLTFFTKKKSRAWAPPTARPATAAAPPPNRHTFPCSTRSALAPYCASHVAASPASAPLRLA